jgi:TPR repeat protein
MRRTAAAVILIISLIMAVPACTGPSEDADKAYHRGDYKTAYPLFKQLAEQGNVKAQNNLGEMYFNGRGVPKDYVEAMKWFRKAAGQGNAQAQFNLGLMYVLGQGVPQDYAEAMKWYRKAAEQGNALAQFNLGSMYAKGHGVPQDNVLAYVWFDLAVPQFPASKKMKDLTASRMTPVQIAEAQRLAREWKPKKEQ